MSPKKLLGRILFFGFLQVSVLMGARITPEDIEKIMNVMHRTRVVHILRTEDDDEKRQSRSRER